jgi:hypothetical protein
MLSSWDMYNIHLLACHTAAACHMAVVQLHATDRVCKVYLIATTQHATLWCMPLRFKHVGPHLITLTPCMCLWPVLCLQGGLWKTAAVLPIAAVHTMQVTGRYNEFLCIVSGPF